MRATHLVREIMKKVITILLCSIGLFFPIHFINDQTVSSQVRFTNIIGVNLSEVFNLNSLLDGDTPNRSYSIRFLDKDGVEINPTDVSGFNGEMKIALRIHNSTSYDVIRSYDVICIDTDDFGRITKIERCSEIEGFLLSLTLYGLVNYFKEGRFSFKILLAKELNLNVEPFFSAIDLVHYYAWLRDLRKEQGISESSMTDFQHGSLIGKSFLGDPSGREVISNYNVRLFELNEAEVMFFFIDSNTFAEVTHLKDSNNLDGLIRLKLKIEGISYEIIRISIDDFGKVKGIYRGKSGEDFLIRRVFSQLKEHFTEIEGFAEELDINLNFSDSDMMKYHEFVALRREERVIANSVVSIKTFERESIEDSDDALGVFQNYYGILKYNEDSDRNALKTFGASNCVILIVYDVKNQVGYMNHINGSTWGNDINKTEQFLLRMRDLFNQAGGELLSKSQISISTNGDLLNDNEIEITVIGGMSTLKSRLYIHNIREILINTFYFSSFNQDILTGKSENAWLDLKNGEISAFNVNPSLESNELPRSFEYLSLSPNVQRTKGSLASSGSLNSLCLKKIKSIDSNLSLRKKK